MRRTGMWLSALAVVAFAGGASAIVVDGNFDDWFSYGGTHKQVWDDVAATNSILDGRIRQQNDPEDDADGGQPYDIEQIFYFFDDTTPGTLDGGFLYIGIVTGYNPAAAYKSGDLFIDLGADGSFDLATATGTDVPGRFGKTWVNEGWDDSAPILVGSNTFEAPYRIIEGNGGATLSPLATSIAWGLPSIGAPGNVHNFLEICIELDGAFEEQVNNGLGQGGLGLHWTMECGNDSINVLDNTPLNPVPEPTTMVLLGMGVLGMALRARRPVC